MLGGTSEEVEAGGAGCGKTVLKGISLPEKFDLICVIAGLFESLLLTLPTVEDEGLED